MGIVGLTVLVAIYEHFYFYLQRNIVYSPQKYTIDDEKITLEKYGLPSSCVIDLVAADKTRLRGYWIPKDREAEEYSSHPTILYLHVD